MKKTITEKEIQTQIEGMHCDACEVILERRIKKISGVTKVTVSRSKGKASIKYTRLPTHKELADAINHDGYQLSENKQLGLSKKDYAEIGAVFIIVVGLYLVLQRFDFLPDIGISESMGLGLVFLIGLIAATSTCLAVTGGLLLALASKYSEQHPNLTGKQKFKPTLYFNIGRLAGYTSFGAALGGIGSLFAFSAISSGILTITAAIIMIILGLQMLQIFPFLNHIKVKPPKFIAHSIYDTTSGAYKPWAPFVLGASTFFLPCGFTQALQFFVLAKGSAIVGASTMLVFSLGTLPVLLAVGVVSSFSKGNFQKHFIRIAAVIVIILGLISLPAGLTLLNLASGPVVQATIVTP